MLTSLHIKSGAFRSTRSSTLVRAERSIRPCSLRATCARADYLSRTRTSMDLFTPTRSLSAKLATGTRCTKRSATSLRTPVLISLSSGLPPATSPKMTARWSSLSGGTRRTRRHFSSTSREADAAPYFETFWRVQPPLIYTSHTLFI